MKKFNDVQEQLLHYLQDHCYHSGNKLAEKIGLSRTAVWKNIQTLRALGVPILSSQQKGYQLNPRFTPIDLSFIQQSLTAKQYPVSFEADYFAEISSTNSFLKTRPGTNRRICCAEKQTAGRGRFGRNWCSPFGDNIYFSMSYTHTGTLSDFSGLSLVVSLAIHHCLTRYLPQETIQIKWPNDLMWQGKKLGGVLIELSGESHGEIKIIIGIGINVNTDGRLTVLADQPYCSLYDISGQVFNRNFIIVDLMSVLETYLDSFWQQGFASFKADWDKVDYLLNKEVTIHYENQVIQGLCLGINDQGLLAIKTADENVHYLLSGETVLR